MNGGRSLPSPDDLFAHLCGCEETQSYLPVMRFSLDAFKKMELWMRENSGGIDQYRDVVAAIGMLTKALALRGGK